MCMVLVVVTMITNTSTVKAATNISTTVTCEHDHHHHGHDHGHSHSHEHGAVAIERTIGRKMLAISEIALNDFLDIAAFLVIGAALAALVRTILPTSKMELISAYQSPSIFGMMLFAMLLSLCSEADAFVAANFGTMSVASKLAFMLIGPMLDCKLFIMYRWVFRKEIVTRLVASLIVLVAVIAHIVAAVSYFIPK